MKEIAEDQIDFELFYSQRRIFAGDSAPAYLSVKPGIFCTIKYPFDVAACSVPTSSFHFIRAIHEFLDWVFSIGKMARFDGVNFNLYFEFLDENDFVNNKAIDLKTCIVHVLDFEVLGYIPISISDFTFADRIASLNFIGEHLDGRFKPYFKIAEWTPIYDDISDSFKFIYECDNICSKTNSDMLIISADSVEHNLPIKEKFPLFLPYRKTTERIIDTRVNYANGSYAAEFDKCVYELNVFATAPCEDTFNMYCDNLRRYFSLWQLGKLTEKHSVAYINDYILKNLVSDVRNEVLVCIDDKERWIETDKFSVTDKYKYVHLEYRGPILENTELNFNGFGVTL
ncbi:MAG: hypothetical protein EOL88_08365 [Bacteroidia bacterium]|nr:hypothetical protein [Bacteroidia bacterium]